jgi:hypothetical protein
LNIKELLLADIQNEWWKIEVFGRLFIALLYFSLVQDRSSTGGGGCDRNCTVTAGSNSAVEWIIFNVLGKTDGCLLF